MLLTFWWRKRKSPPPLPPELIEAILSHLEGADSRDYLRLARISRSWRDVCWPLAFRHPHIGISRVEVLHSRMRDMDSKPETLIVSVNSSRQDEHALLSLPTFLMDATILRRIEYRISRPAQAFGQFAPGAHLPNLEELAIIAAPFDTKRGWQSCDHAGCIRISWWVVEAPRLRSLVLEDVLHVIKIKDEDRRCWENSKITSLRLAERGPLNDHSDLTLLSFLAPSLTLLRLEALSFMHFPLSLWHPLLFPLVSFELFCGSERVRVDHYPFVVGEIGRPQGYQHVHGMIRGLLSEATMLQHLTLPFDLATARAYTDPFFASPSLISLRVTSSRRLLLADVRGLVERLSPMQLPSLRRVVMPAVYRAARKGEMMRDEQAEQRLREFSRLQNTELSFSPVC